MRCSVTVEPSVEPVTTAEAKAHLKVDHSADDTMIGVLVKAARRNVEQYIGRSLVTQTRKVILDSRETAPPIVLPYGPVTAVTAFRVYEDDNSTETAVTASAYYLAGDRLCMSEATSAADWPTMERAYDACYVTYTAGYGLAAAVPEDIKQAVLITVADLYENRETLIGAGLVVTEVPVNAKILLAPYINYQLS